MSSGVFITTNNLRALSLSAQKEIQALFFNSLLSNEDKESEDGPTDISSRQAEKLVHGLSPKSRSVLLSIIKRNGEFLCKDLASEFKVDVSYFTGVWSGLTRRIRTVTGDSEAILIGWSWNEKNDDYIGRLNQVTTDNCKKAMSL